ncbi:MAG: hypothetical protein HYZ73_08445 [Elusimicrobia bacterium]|nr:hypothetical protein [Elusimicrobiota bacterium]
MNAQLHPGLSVEKWRSRPYADQILHIASELNRTQHWMKRNEQGYVQGSLERALELIDLTVSSNQGTRPLRELLRLREALGGYYVGLSKEYDEFVLLLQGLLVLDKDVQKLRLELLN